jgi:hypothetical protein
MISAPMYFISIYGLMDYLVPWMVAINKTVPLLGKLLIKKWFKKHLLKQKNEIILRIHHQKNQKIKLDKNPLPCFCFTAMVAMKKIYFPLSELQKVTILALRAPYDIQYGNMRGMLLILMQMKINSLTRNRHLPEI